MKDTGFDNNALLTSTMRATGPRNPKSAPLSSDSQHLIYETDLVFLAAALTVNLSKNDLFGF